MNKLKINESDVLDSTIPPLIKWTGSKRSQAFQIFKLFPKRINKYYEPFVGSGALLYLLTNRQCIACDIYPPLIKLWNFVKNKPLVLINNYRSQWEKLQKELPDYFYLVRKRFNATQNPLDLNFLLRTCVNGIVRFNRKGHFNNSFHLSRKGMHPDRFEGIVNDWNSKTKNISFYCQDYLDTVNISRGGDFVYLDPPYQGSKNRYTNNLDTKRMFEALEMLNKKNVKWALSFDGKRNGVLLGDPVPKDIYKRHIYIKSGFSPVKKVLSGPIEMVEESLYLNY